MLKKICRICTNDKQWTKPSGNKSLEDPKSFPGQNGFGFEEWLNRPKWSLYGYNGDRERWRYIHIPSLSQTDKNIGKELDILLYTKKPNERALAVGDIKNAYLIDKNEASWAAKQIIDRGYLSIMHKEVAAVAGRVAGLPPLSWKKDTEEWKALYFANIRFKQENLSLYKEPYPIDIKCFRYKTALNWQNVSIVQPRYNHTNKLDQLLESYLIETRTIYGKTVTKNHLKLQKKLIEVLDNNFDAKGYNILPEKDRVDIQIRCPDNSLTFVEIKIAKTARSAIRQSLGQLLEYAHHSKNNRRLRFVIVSDCVPTDKDELYLQLLRKKYKIPVCYVGWSSRGNKIQYGHIEDFIK